MHACRYEDLIFDTEAYTPATDATYARVEAVERKGIHRLKVYVASNDQSLNLETDESYALTVTAPTSTLEARAASSHACMHARGLTYWAKAQIACMHARIKSHRMALSTPIERAHYMPFSNSAQWIPLLA